MSAAEDSNFEVLTDGRLAKLDEWNEDVARSLASRDGITLTDQHWQVINAIREYYAAFNVAPIRKLLKRELKRRTQSDVFDDDILHELFPGDVLVQGTKIAGVPIPMMDAELERRTYQAKAVPAVAHFIDSFDFEGETYAVSRTGNLLELHRWNALLAEYMAEKEGISLTEAHWEVLNFLREFYFTYGISPMVKILMRYMAEDIGPEHASKEYLYSLFPKGPARQGSRIAGLPEPQGCLDPDT
jgi:TusE/DsrC/DsvC family sulfur relay protein